MWIQGTFLGIWVVVKIKFKTLLFFIIVLVKMLVAKIAWMIKELQPKWDITADIFCHLYVLFNTVIIRNSFQLLRSSYILPFTISNLQKISIHVWLFQNLWLLGTYFRVQRLRKKRFSLWLLLGLKGTFKALCHTKSW